MSDFLPDDDAPKPSEDVIGLITRLWPRKFQREELVDFAARLERYRIDDVRKALDEHKNTSKFPPRVSEILAKLKGKDWGEGGGAEVKWPSHADVIRASWGQPNMSDFEAILRFHRQVWFRYKADADKRGEQTQTAGPAADSARAMLEAQRDGMLRKCKIGCAYELAAAGMEAGIAGQYAEGVALEDVWAFQSDYLRAIREVRPLGVEEGATA